MLGNPWVAMWPRKLMHWQAPASDCNQLIVPVQWISNTLPSAIWRLHQCNNEMSLRIKWGVKEYPVYSVPNQKIHNPNKTTPLNPLACHPQEENYKKLWHNLDKKRGQCRLALGCLGSQPAPISAPWKPGRYQIMFRTHLSMSMRKQIHCTLMLWDATHDKLYEFPWFPVLLFFIFHEKLSFPGFQGLFLCPLTIPWEIIFPWFPGLVFFNVHWPSLSVASRAPLMHEHEKTFSYHCGIQVIIIIIIDGLEKTCHFKARWLKS